jgi:CHAT domain-containing protein
LACLLKQIALKIAESQATADSEELISLLNEVHILLSNMEKTGPCSLGFIKLGGLYFALGKFEDAIKCYHEGIRVGKMVGVLSMEITAHLQLGTVYEELGQWENALAIYTNTLATAKGYPFVSIQTLISCAGRARCLWRTHRFEDALQECQSYLKLNSRLGKPKAIQFHSVEFRPTEKSNVNELMMHLLFENSQDNTRALEHSEYAKTEKPLLFNQLMAFLDQQEIPITVAEYYITKEYTMLFIVDAAHDILTTYHLPISAQRIHNCLDLLVEEVHRYQNWGTGLETTWQELINPVIAPLVSHLNDEGILYIIPHGLLHHIPFHAIQHGHRYLIEYGPIAYAPSISSLMKSREHPSEDWKRAIVVGDPGRDLGGATREAREVAKLFNVIPRVGQDAKFDLHRQIIDTDILHVATHGLFDPDRPKQSGLLLADELLTIPKIAEMQIQANLVTLSGCETGVSQIVPGKQLVGLSNAFLRLGVPSLIVSLWQADDAATTDLMISFYTKLRSGTRSLAHALRSAQLGSQRSASWQHPYFWAPFILVGNWH